LEQGEFGLKPERSHNVNLNVGYNGKLGKHGLFADAGLVLRDTRDYIQRNIVDLSGGKSAATYINYGKVLTKGYNVTLRYTWDRWLSIGGNFTDMRVLDNMKTAIGSSVPNLGYGEKMPNLPSMFADFDVTLYWHGLGGKDNLLTFTYDGQYVQEFSYYSARIGSNKGDYIVPDQLSHNISLVYSLKSGRYNIALECRNVTDERLYDNFSLQKPGRAFYAKFRVKLGK
jgi:outer membrane receptor protein involved in Fe transport